MSDPIWTQGGQYLQSIGENFVVIGDAYRPGDTPAVNPVGRGSVSGGTTEQ